MPDGRTRIIGFSPMSSAQALIEDIRLVVDRALSGDQTAMLQIVDRVDGLKRKVETVLRDSSTEVTAQC